MLPWREAVTVRQSLIKLCPMSKNYAAVLAIKVKCHQNPNASRQHHNACCYHHINFWSVDFQFLETHRHNAHTHIPILAIYLHNGGQIIMGRYTV